MVALGDQGSVDYLQSTFDRLQAVFDIRIYADPSGKAKDGLAKLGIAHTVSDGSSIDLVGVDAVLCGTAEKAFGLWRAVHAKAREAEVHIAWFGDFYGSGCGEQVADLAPDFVAVFDDTTRQSFLKLRQGFNPNCVWVVGNPSFDMLADFDVQAARAKMRRSLGLKKGEFFVLDTASSLEQFLLKEESLDKLVPWVRGRGVSFAVCFHPADVKKHEVTIAGWNKWMRSVLGLRFVDIGEHRGLPLIAAADMVVTDWSTEGVKSCLLGIPTGFIMLRTAQEYLWKRKLQPGSFSILQDLPDSPAPAISVTNMDDMYRLDYGFAPPDRADLARALQHKRFEPLRDGKAGARFLGFVREMVS